MTAEALLVAFAALAWASPGAAPCAAIEGVGCLYLPAKPAKEAPAPLLVFLRGHLAPYGGSVPEGERVASARQALAKFELRALADREGLALLVTGSSDVSVSDELLSVLERRAGLSFGKLTLAAHSGGNVGLSKSLGRVRRPERIVMLDNFYFAESLSRAIQREVAAGTVCAGFFTAHNRERYEKRFKPFVYCPVQDRSDLGHDGGVNRCLARYFVQTTCD